MNQQETAKLLAVMQTVWTERDTGVDASEQAFGYWLGLKDVAYDDAVAALERCVKELKFFPKPAEILERLPRATSALTAGQASKRAPRSAYELGYLPWPENGSLVTNEVADTVPTLADILAREAGQRPEPVSLPARITERKKAVGE